ncbi:MAG: HIT family protein [Chloroflexi bacterium]|nr:MAG: HIT family protein [Chloroflexota bacterium]TMD53089.1 MAG: HIT family protein [Chloroflexota bacterium]
MSDCVFCQIVEGQAPASVVFSDGTVMAIMDIAPIVPGHLLVFPKRHAQLLAELQPGEGAACWVIAETMARALRGSGLRVEGVNLFVADGEAAFQDVPHFHIHVIPRHAGDGFSLSFPESYGQPVERTALDDAAARIRSGLGA